MTTITLTGNYEYESYRVSGLPEGTIIDASTATFIHDNDASDGQSNPYPFLVYDSPGVVLQGGTILGNIDLTSEWRTVYDAGNAAAVRTEGTPNVVIRDWRIDDTWDAIRVSWNSPNFLIEDVWVTDARDDAIENDRLQSGTIRDSLFDGVFSGLSIDPSSSSPVDGHNETVTFEGVLLRLESYLYNGELTHGPLIKTDSATDGTVTPNLRFINNVFAIEDVDHRSYRSMFDAWANTVYSSGNVFLNLSDTPLPSDYPMPPDGWTVLQGQEARDYWEQARDAWIANHTDGSEPPVIDPSLPPVDEPLPPPPDDQTPPPSEEETPPPSGEETPPPPEDESPPVTEDDVPTFSGTRFVGDSGNNTVVGNALDNYIDGNNGDDTIKGGNGDDILRGDDGADVLWGGAGEDTYFFKRVSDSRGSTGIDIIMDFEQGDKIDLSKIDASREAPGDQAFHLITGAFSGTPGELRITFDTSGHTVINATVDNDLEPEITIMLEGHVDLTASDFIL
jgi:hypothetical protein